MSRKKAILLLSGGLDSATTLSWAKAQGFRVFCLIIDYAQRHKQEVECAKRIAHHARCSFEVVKVVFPWGGSALLDKRIKIPVGRSLKIMKKEIPKTYVPSRNIIFLSLAVSWAESVNAQAVLIGANAVDYSGYPDCRPSFFKAIEKVFNKGTKAGIDQRPIKILTPLIKKTKAQIIQTGFKLKVPYHLTWSCYQGGRRPCGICDSCQLRKKGFIQAKREDPLL